MNVAKAIELAYAAVVREYAELGKSTLIRAWQSLAVDGSWDETKDRDFPVVDIRCGPPKPEQSQATMMADVALLCGTKTDDDKDHAVISALYEAVQDVCDKLYAQFQTGTDGAELTTFKASLEALLAPTTFHFSGLTFGETQPPYNDRGVNMIGITMGVHYGRPDC